jgi:NADH:ubiquinone oxidoreductase subunit K
MVNVRPYAYAFLVLAVFLFIIGVIVGLSGSPADVFFLLTSLLSAGLSVVMFKKYREDKRLRRF